MEKIKIDVLNKKIETDENLVIIFTTEWCGQCKMSKELMEKIIENYSNVVFLEIDVDDNNLWDNESLGIKKVPITIGYKNKKIIFNEHGFQNEEKLNDLLKQLKT